VSARTASTSSRRLPRKLPARPLPIHQQQTIIVQVTSHHHITYISPSISLRNLHPVTTSPHGRDAARARSGHSNPLNCQLKTISGRPLTSHQGIIKPTTTTTTPQSPDIFPRWDPTASLSGLARPTDGNVSALVLRERHVKYNPPRGNLGLLCGGDPCRPSSPVVLLHAVANVLGRLVRRQD
jgi:hypothetical protein